MGIYGITTAAATYKQQHPSNMEGAGEDERRKNQEADKESRKEERYTPTYLLRGGLQEVKTGNNVYDYYRKKRNEWKLKTMTLRR